MPRVGVFSISVMCGSTVANRREVEHEDIEITRG